MTEPSSDTAATGDGRARPGVQELYHRLMHLQWSDLPDAVQRRAARLVADCLAAAYAVDS